MPQLDPSTFATQLVWLIITFVILYLILWKSALPRIASILQDRQERIDDDLEKAEKLKKEAEIALEDYQRIVSDGRRKAQEITREASQKMAIETTQRQNTLTEKLAKNANEAETRIQKAQWNQSDSVVLILPLAKSRRNRINDGYSNTRVLGCRWFYSYGCYQRQTGMGNNY